MSYWGQNRFFEAQSIQAPSGWGTYFSDPAPNPKPEFAEDEQLKRLFGIELAKDHHNPFAAASEIFENASHALWAANNWISDPIVIAARDTYKNAVEAKGLLLDKEQLAAKLLKFEAEKNPKNPQFPLHDSKDRLAALKLYAEVCGYIGKFDLSTTNNFSHNEMQIKFVTAKQEASRTIEHRSEEALIDDDSIQPLPLNIKLIASKG